MTECVVCTRPVADQAYVCARCGIDRPARDLAAIADMAAAARDVAHGFTRQGGPAGPSAAESRIPLNLGAMARLDAVQNALSGWCRHIAAERGTPLPMGATRA